jgi:hypothetical protein
MIAVKRAINTFITDNPMSAPLQGQDSIIINASTETLWPLVVDSKRLEDWGPPVTSVEIMTNPGQPEKLGSYRRVDAELNGKAGYFIHQ